MFDEKRLAFYCLAIAAIGSALLFFLSKEPVLKGVDGISALDAGKTLSVRGIAMVSSRSSKSFLLCSETCIRVISTRIPENNSLATITGKVGKAGGKLEITEIDRG